MSRIRWTDLRRVGRFVRLGFSLVRPVSCGEWLGLMVAAVVGGLCVKGSGRIIKRGVKAERKVRTTEQSGSQVHLRSCWNGGGPCGGAESVG